ncbi:DUF6879 family protein [Actinomadura sp. WMMB 499]|uniref:DUF6879 family protein n=1 Tax=Actinomadura sp. WMMB 499 TaxID=1219491 RepID=UPI001244EAC7|nr:DUF6879 family protein [Actinomadura sp. WMMB 499]QFG21396.1 hypothetical protein F7P10_09860 [Actinomadura sp. WMMB 499]
MGIVVPANDFWAFDNELVRFGHFSGRGDYLGADLVESSDIVNLCADAFEAVWDRATPHEEYRPE